MRSDLTPGSGRSTGLVDVLDRVLDKGLVVAGDIKVSLAEVELLTIRIRLIVCSLDKAEAIGLDWWRHDRFLSSGSGDAARENEALREEVRALREQVRALGAGATPGRRRAVAASARGRGGGGGAKRRKDMGSTPGAKTRR